ncbi:MAG: hypothetical protein JNG84_12545, partial [Archangium sp.]|nr:hypothetical protein [Archangium sp.]
MKKTLIIAALALSSLSGCVTMRFVTARTWVGSDTLYVAYTEYEKVVFSESFEAKLLRCNRQPDNALACTPEEQVNQLLNEGNS